MGRPGEVLGGRYRLTRPLASGGMAEVWEGHDERLDRAVAVKMLRPHLGADRGFVTRFQREAMAVARLGHPNVVTVYDTGTEPATPSRPAARAYIVMELVRGESLRARLARGVTLTEAVSIGAQVARGLEHAHRQGLVHRDIKPANILVQPDGHTKVADFGIAKAIAGGSLHDDGEDLTQAGAILGTAKYLSPEQVSGDPVDNRSDLYSLGVVLYEMVCGRPPYVAKNELATAMLHTKGGAPRPRQVRVGIPRALDELIMRAMALNPAERFADAGALAEGLDRIDTAQDDAVPVVSRQADDRTPEPPLHRAAPARRRGPGSVGAAAEATRIDKPVTPVRGPSTRVEGPRTRTRPARQRIWGAVVLTALFGAGLGSAAGMLTANRRTDDRLSLESARARSFDPEGGDGEHEEQLALLLDRKPATAWSTEHYPLRTFSATKTGVGVVIQLAKMAKIDQVVIAPSNRGWSGQVFVDVAPHAELAQWGVASGQFDSIAGNTRVSIRPKLGQFVLVWITDLGPDRQARIAEISVKGT